MKIQQKHYPEIEVDQSEPDIIQLFQRAPLSGELDVTQIERATLPAIAAALGFSPEEIWKEACEACLAVVSEVSTAGSLSLERMTPPLPDKYLTPNQPTP